MKIAFIGPTKHLKEFSCYKDNSYHMILAQHIIGDEKYREFYEERRRKGDFLLLDNGAYEFGQSVNKEVLIKAALLSQPNLLVLPDKRGFKKETIEMSYDFLNTLKHEIPKHTRIMAVTQGSNRADWLSCFLQFANDPDIDTIGISSTHGFLPRETHYFSRAETIEYLAENDLIPKGKTIHLCGVGNSGHIELERLKKFEFIEGVDTSAPVIHGLNNVRIIKNEKYTKILDLLDFDMEVEKSKYPIILENLDLFYHIVYD